MTKADDLRLKIEALEEAKRIVEDAERRCGWGEDAIEYARENIAHRIERLHIEKAAAQRQADKARA